MGLDRSLLILRSRSFVVSRLSFLALESSVRMGLLPQVVPPSLLGHSQCRSSIAPSDGLESYMAVYFQDVHPMFIIEGSRRIRVEAWRKERYLQYRCRG